MINGRSNHVWLRRTFALAGVGAILFGWLVVGSEMAFADEQLSAGSNSKQFRKQTVQAIPYHQLNQETKEKISPILNKPNIYRRLPVTSISADPDYFRFLTRYPEVIVNIWKLMGVTKMTTERTGPFSVSTNDGAGTLSSLELVYGSDNLHIFYGTGSYEGPVFRRKLTGKCVLVLRTESRVDANGKPLTTSQLDVFLKIDNATIGLVAKTIQPIIGPTADHNFVESLKFVQRLNETTEKNGPGVQQMANKLDLDRDVQQKFIDVVDVVFQRAVNAMTPLEPRKSIRPASHETRFSSPAQPAGNLSNPSFSRQRNPASSGQLPVYDRLNDLGNHRVQHGNFEQQPNQPQPVAQTAYLNSAWSRTQNSQIPVQANGYGLPARGYQAPAYSVAAPRINNPIYSVRPESPGYRFNAPASPSSQTQTGWRPRQSLSGR